LQNEEKRGETCHSVLETMKAMQDGYFTVDINEIEVAKTPRQIIPNNNGGGGDWGLFVRQSAQTFAEGPLETQTD